MVVDASFRSLGIGRKLLLSLLERVEPGGDVWLVTIPSSSGFYARHGFTIASDPNQIPSAINLERFAGQFVARLVGADTCLAMRWTRED